MWETVKKWTSRLFAQRAVSMPSIYQLVGAELDSLGKADGVYRPLIDVYLDGGQMFAIFAMNGKLFKVDLKVGKGKIALSEPMQVEIDYKPATQTLVTRKQKDGKYRWFAFPAATAVLNRSGELDSRELFDSFEEHISQGAAMPFLSFYHVTPIQLGMADYVKRDGYTLLISGLWNDNPLAMKVREALERDPDHYGISIGYKYLPETKKRMEIGDGITIPVYTDGILMECSILAEEDAACLFTGVYTEGVERMNQKAKDELEKIVAGDPDLEAQVKELEEKVDTVNASTEGLVRREETQKEPQAEPQEEPAEDLPPEFELTEEAIQTIASKAAENLKASIEAITQQIADVVAKISTFNEQFATMNKRLQKVETPLEEAIKQTVADLPRAVTRVGYRPTKPQVEQPEPEKVSLEDIAQATLANIL